MLLLLSDFHEVTLTQTTHPPAHTHSIVSIGTRFTGHPLTDPPSQPVFDREPNHVILLQCLACWFMHIELNAAGPRLLSGPPLHLSPQRRRA